MIAASYPSTLAPAAFFELPRALKACLDRISFDVSGLAPIETFVDWLEAAYGGPIGPEKPSSRS